MTKTQGPKHARKILPLGREVAVETTTHTIHKGRLAKIVSGWLVLESPTGRSFVDRSKVEAVNELTARSNGGPTPPAGIPPRMTGILGRPRVRTTLASLIAGSPPEAGEDVKDYVRRLGYKSNRVWTAKDEQHFASTLQRYGFRVEVQGKKHAIVPSNH